MELSILRELVRQACPDWLQGELTDEPKAFLQNLIDRVLPGALGVCIEHIDAEQILGSVPYRRESANVAGLMHGATIFALGDTLAGALLWATSDGTYYGVSANCSITYLRPVSGGTLHCRVYETRRTESRVHMVALFTSDGGKRVARLRMEYAIVRLARAQPKSVSERE
ncbi:MAG: PaaI family thioesterase [Spirochaetales bacterium]|nr:PaaI family thioesterase [Spirochaetales bacterium]